MLYIRCTANAQDKVNDFSIKFFALCTLSARGECHTVFIEQKSDEEETATVAWRKY